MRYVEAVMGLNFLVDFLLLSAAARLTGEQLRLAPVTAAAGLGGLYGGLCLLPGLDFLGSILWRLIFLGLMGVLAFGFRWEAAVFSGLFVLLSMTLAGLVLAMRRPGAVGLLASAAVLWGICTSFSLPGRLYVPVRIRQQGQTLRLTALRDTGNCLRDPVTGEPVLVIAPSLAEKLTGLTPQQLRQPIQTILASPVPGLRLIPYRAVGGSGLLLGQRFSDVRIGWRQGAAVVAFAPEGLEEGRFQALTGGRMG